MLSPVFYGDVEAGKLTLRRPDLLHKYLASLDGSVVIQIEKEKKKRSRSQNNLYWLWLGIIGAAIGYSKEEMHDVFSHKYLVEKRDIVAPTGEMITANFIRSTTSMNKAEMSDYMMKVERDAIELGIVLPSPDMYFA